MQCPAKAMPFQQIIMHALQSQHDVDVHLLFCFDIDLHLTCSQLPCITWIFFVDLRWWVPLCVQRPTIYVPFWHIIMYILQCPHDIHVHLFCFDLHKFLLRSHAATCPSSNCVTSLFRQELTFIFFPPPRFPTITFDRQVPEVLLVIGHVFFWRFRTPGTF